MNFLYKKNELLFAIFWIVLYVVGLSLADRISEAVGLPKSVTVIVCLILTGILVSWIKRNDFMKYYGLCRSGIQAKKLLFYVPLGFLASVNLWFGVTVNGTATEVLLYMGSMLLVGFLEEIIFRGFLFRAMSKENVKTAIIVSSVTFGIGHIVNLINGSGADLFSNLLQICYAITGGFLFTILFYKTKSLWACIITHGVLNALSIFADESSRTTGQEVFSSLALMGISLLYTCYVIRQVKK